MVPVIFHRSASLSLSYELKCVSTELITRSGVLTVSQIRVLQMCTIGSVLGCVNVNERGNNLLQTVRCIFAHLVKQAPRRTSLTSCSKFMMKAFVGANFSFHAARHQNSSRSSKLGWILYGFYISFLFKGDNCLFNSSKTLSRFFP